MELAPVPRIWRLQQLCVPPVRRAGGADHVAAKRQGMAARKAVSAVGSKADLIQWLSQERERVLREVERFATGKSQLCKQRSGVMVDVTGEALKDLRRRNNELERKLEELGSPVAPADARASSHGPRSKASSPTASAGRRPGDP
ncbi:hypothetical protein E2493_14285 [Sphingomonas parva]|uniref:Uncharacterized protein n=1 Tax=Sphingomonas parva TaxID=2555898 RepID=A0A4Y8ZPZ9_9SPHN|nr:hypothetical protein [Sphingomonas parva]TFI57537.1 hypothetical protein E2493_14285 [Sphingomonas parva]